MNRLQIQSFGPDFSSFLVHSYGYEPANEPNLSLKPPNFRFGPASPVGSWYQLPLAILRSSASTKRLSFFIIALKSSGRSDCGPSLAASSGQG